jgi:predicted membrane protein
VTQETVTETSSASDRAEQSSSEEDEEAEVTTERHIEWRRDLVATYRHLREHGNSAFIFLFELALAGLVFCVITKPGQWATQQLAAIGSLFTVWALPAVFVHFLGQHLERRFSRYDRRL